MNNKELVSEIAGRLKASQSDTAQRMEMLVAVLREQLIIGNSIHLNAFGAFEVKKKIERISVNPVTKKRLLIPPKLTLDFKPSTALKERFAKLQKQ